MILLSATNESIQIVSTGSTISLDCVTSWADHGIGSFTPGSSNTKISSATTTSIIGSPSADHQRQVKGLVVTNVHGSLSADVQIYKVAGASSYALTGAITLQPGESVSYTDNDGFVLPANHSAIFDATLYVKGPGGGTHASLTNLEIQSYDTQNSFIQNNIQNISSGGSASCDWVATSDNGSDSNYYVDFGVNSSGYNDSSWSIGAANDGYAYCKGGNFALGAATSGKNVHIFTGGQLSSNKRAAFSDTYQAIFNYGLEQRLGGVVWNKTTTTTLASWTTATSILGNVSTGVGTLTFPANFFIVGRTLRIRIFGRITTTSTPPTMTFVLNLGGVAVCTTGARSMLVSNDTLGFMLEYDLVCRATGSSATIMGIGNFTFSDNGGVDASWNYFTTTTTAANVDTTASAVLDITAACSASSASNTLACVNCVVEVIN